MTINRRTIKNWLRSLKRKPVSPGLERINILFTIGLTLVSTFIALMTFRQQQEIKGMKSLLMKQDTIIDQNRGMISRLDKTQNYIIEQIDAVKTQTKSNEYSSKPILNVTGSVSLTLHTNDIYQIKTQIVFDIKNYGVRPASNIKVTGAWLKLEDNILNSWLELKPTKPSESLLPNQVLTFSLDKDFTDLELKEFATLYFVLNIEYFDPLTKNIEIVNVFKKQNKSYTDRLGQRFSLTDVSKAELTLLRKFKLRD